MKQVLVKVVLAVALCTTLAGCVIAPYDPYPRPYYGYYGGGYGGHPYNGYGRAWR